MINAVGASPVNNQPPAAMPPMTPPAAPQMSAPMAAAPAPQPTRSKSGFSPKLLVGLVAFVLVVVGAFAAFNLTQQKGVGDPRQQASGGACVPQYSCATSSEVCCGDLVKVNAASCPPNTKKCFSDGGGNPIPTPKPACAASGECVEDGQDCCGDLVKVGAGSCSSGKKCVGGGDPVPTEACFGQDVCISDAQTCCGNLVKVNSTSCPADKQKKCVTPAGTPVPTVPQACIKQYECATPAQTCCGNLVKVNAASCPAGTQKCWSNVQGTPVPTAPVCSKQYECATPSQTCCSGLIKVNATSCPSGTQKCWSNGGGSPVCQAGFEPFGSCTQTCLGQSLINMCGIAGATYSKWTCTSFKGTIHWTPDPTTVCSNVQCPWPMTNGKCCPTGADKCSTPGAEQCFGDPWISICTPWDASCPAGAQNYWKRDHYVESCDITPTPTKKPGTNPTPTKPPVSTPTKPPVGPMCVSINLTDINGNIITGKGDAALKPGSQVKFMCGTGGKPAGVHHYEFQITAPGGVVSNLTAASGNLSDTAYTVAKTGEFTAKCRICTAATTCQAYE